MGVITRRVRLPARRGSSAKCLIEIRKKIIISDEVVLHNDERLKGRPTVMVNRYGNDHGVGAAWRGVAGRGRPGRGGEGRAESHLSGLT